MENAHDQGRSGHSTSNGFAARMRSVSNVLLGPSTVTKEGDSLVTVGETLSPIAERLSVFYSTAPVIFSLASFMTMP